MLFLGGSSRVCLIGLNTSASRSYNNQHVDLMYPLVTAHHSAWAEMPLQRCHQQHSFIHVTPAAPAISTSAAAAATHAACSSILVKTVNTIDTLNTLLSFLPNTTQPSNTC